MKIVILLLAVTVLALPALAQEKKMAAKPAKGASVEAAVKGLEDGWGPAPVHRMLGYPELLQEVGLSKHSLGMLAT